MTCSLLQAQSAADSDCSATGMLVDGLGVTKTCYTVLFAANAACKHKYITRHLCTLALMLIIIIIIIINIIIIIIIIIIKLPN
jgi:hypothetical protein